MRLKAPNAYGHARVRARRSRLLRHRDATALSLASDSAAALRMLTNLGRSATSVEHLAASRVEQLVSDYRMVLRSHPMGGDLVWAFLRRFEVENLKLVWRAVVRGFGQRDWNPYWYDLGDLATISRHDSRDVTSDGDLRRLVARSAYADVIASALGSHDRDPVGFELTLDRWVSQQLLHAATALPRSEDAAAALARMVVRERDIELLRRGPTAYGIAPDLVAAMTVLLSKEYALTALQRLASWKPAMGPIADAVPRGLLEPDRHPHGWNDVRTALRQARQRACNRAFLGPPFRLVSAAALLLLSEEEARALPALVEAAGNDDTQTALAAALAPSLMGGA